MGNTRRKTEVDFLRSSTVPPPASPDTAAHRRRRWWLAVRLSIYLVVVLLIVGFTLSYRVIFSSSGVLNTESTPVFQQLSQLVTADDKPLQGEASDRVNILLIGIGGPGHAGSYLADTIILASIQPSTKRVSLLSIPRDLYVPIPGFDWRKINNANAFGYLSGKTGGEELLSQVVEHITGQTVHYFARVDFEAFRQIIDAVGGVDINVEKSFTDYEYPDYNFGYQTVRFQAGPQLMDGERALQFTRSRKGTNGEGSDFARARRQQLVLAAVRKKVFSLGTLFKPSTLYDLSAIIGDHAKTNMELWEILKLGQWAKQIDTGAINNVVIDSSAGSVVHAETTIDGAYILRPNAGPDDFSEIIALADGIFDAPPVEAGTTVEIQNGTTSTGLAKLISDQLEPIGFTVAAITNAQQKGVEQTVIYDLSLGRKPQALKRLRTLLQANVASSLPVFLRPEKGFDEAATGLNIEPDFSADELPTSTSHQPDFLIVLGANQLSINANAN